MKQRLFSTKFWSDSWVVDDLNALDRYLFLYLLLNERSNLIGVYELPLRVAAFETGIDQSDLARMLAKMSPKVEYLQDRYIYVEKAADHAADNPAINKGMLRELAALPAAVREDVRAYGIKSIRLAQVFDDYDTLQATAEVATPNQTPPPDNREDEATNRPPQATSGYPTPPIGGQGPTPHRPGKEKEKEKEKEKLLSSPAPTAQDPVKQLTADVKEVFGFYVKSFNAENSHIKLSTERRRKLEARLKDAGKEMLFAAITNTAASPFHRGDNDRGWKANIDFIIRSYEQVERLATMNAEESVSPTAQKRKPTDEEMRRAMEKL
jgi:hypothetical protein